MKLFLTILLFVVQFEIARSQVVFFETGLPLKFYDGIGQSFNLLIENGYTIDSIYCENGVVHLSPENTIYIKNEQLGLVKIKFFLKSHKLTNDTIIEKHLIAEKISDPIVTFHNKYGNPISKLSEIKDIEIKIIHPNFGGTYSIVSFKSVVFLNDSIFRVFDSENGKFSNEMLKFINLHKLPLVKIIIFDFKYKSPIGNKLLQPIQIMLLE